MRAKRILQGAAYVTRGSFADPLGFVQRVFGKTAEDESTLREVVELIDQTGARLRSRTQSGPLDQSAAARVLQLRDLDRLSRTVANSIHPEDLGEEPLHTCFAALRGILETNGISLGEARVSVRTRFPAPYDKMDFWAMNYDVSDREALGIDIGVVLKRDYLMPLYSSLVLAHELIHTALGQVSTEYLARGFEEGLADLVGTLYLGSHLMPMELCENALVNSRLKYPQEEAWRRYTDALRQALTLCLTAGWDMVMTALREGNRRGRGVIKDMERALVEGNPPRPPNPAVDERPDILRFARRFLAFPEQLVVSPLAYILAERLRLNMPVAELLGENGVDQSVGLAALEELQQRVYLIILSEGKIVADETKPFIHAGVLRYKF